MGALSHGNGQLRAQSISLQVSNRERCNGACKFCISRTTPSTPTPLYESKTLKWRRLEIGLRFAERLGATHVIITGRADPTQEDPTYVTGLIKESTKYLPLCDMHTNGWWLLPKMPRHDSLGYWVDAGLTMITLSLAHHQDKKNSELMGIPEDTKFLIPEFRKHGLMVRCSVVLAKDGIEIFESLMDYIYNVGHMGAQMVVVRELWCPDSYSRANKEVVGWNKENFISAKKMEEEFYFAAYNAKLREKYGIHEREPLPWGTKVFSVDNVWKQDPSFGMNVTFANCGENVAPVLKSIVHKPDGHGYRNWDSNGDILY